jgi:N-acetylglucosaminyldiphosphoundecaprenol N-acetyl-beta-D-mannosaminyltransferase
MSPRDNLTEREMHEVRRASVSSAITPEGRGALPIVTLCGVHLHALTAAGCIAHIMAELHSGRGGWMVTANLDHLRRLVRDPRYGELCRDATLVVADGMPLVWASRLQGTPLPERVAGSDLIWSLSRAAAQAGRSVFLLGGDPGTADAAGKTLMQHFAGLRVAGTYCPEFGFERDPARIESLGQMLVAAQPDIIYVGLGSPKQEELAARLRHRLPTAWWLGVGISFSFVCGRVRRAPPWLRRTGLEWVHRMSQEPKRLAKRYLVHDVPFAVQLGASALRRRVTWK